MAELSELRELLRAEIAQREQEGCDVAAVRAQFERVDETPPTIERFEGLIELLESLRPDPGFPYVEPSDLQGIREAASATSADSYGVAADFEDRVLGAWLGRCAGCLLGKPVEGWTREQIAGYLEAAGERPLRERMPKRRYGRT